ncbi:MAG: hypothetical protein AABZ10_04395 [Nitrospirota bacterium]
MYRIFIFIAAIVLGNAGMNDAVLAASRVETQENISYGLPEGWSVKRFADRDGAATLEHKASGATMSVWRYGLLGKRDAYSNKVALAGGRTLEWQYEENALFRGSFFLLGRVTLTEGRVEMSAVTKDISSGGRVPEEVGLAAMRKIAETALFLGPRKCLGEGCGNGAVKQEKRVKKVR